MSGTLIVIASRLLEHLYEVTLAAFIMSLVVRVAQGAFLEVVGACLVQP